MQGMFYKTSIKHFIVILNSMTFLLVYFVFTPRTVNGGKLRLHSTGGEYRNKTRVKIGG